MYPRPRLLESKEAESKEELFHNADILNEANKISYTPMNEIIAAMVAGHEWGWIALHQRKAQRDINQLLQWMENQEIPAFSPIHLCRLLLMAYVYIAHLEENDKAKTILENKIFEHSEIANALLIKLYAKLLDDSEEPDNAENKKELELKALNAEYILKMEQCYQIAKLSTLGNTQYILAMSAGFAAPLYVIILHERNEEWSNRHKECMNRAAALNYPLAIGKSSSLDSASLDSNSRGLGYIYEAR